MKQKWQPNPNLLAKALIMAIGLIFMTACQSETTDLYQASQPDLKIETTEINLPHITPQMELEVQETPSLPPIGEIQSVTIEPPKGLPEVDPAKIINMEQIISLQNNETKPLLDLLFVIDDSKSMAPHQLNLSNAMEDFTKELSKLDLLDYRIGVTTIYDSKRYYKRGKKGEDRFEQGVTEWSRPLNGEQSQPFTPERNFYRLGRLVPLKADSSGELDFNQRYATPDTDLATLTATLTVGDKPFIKYDNYVTISEPKSTGGDQVRPRARPQVLLAEEAFGPRFEEVLGPMIAALNLKFLLFGNSAEHYRAQFPQTARQNSTPWTPPAHDDPKKEAKWFEFAENYNAGFVRSDAHLGVIFLTDTVDQSVGITASGAAEALRQLKNDDGRFTKISTYGVLHGKSLSPDVKERFPDQWSNTSCHADEDVKPSDSPLRLEAFLQKTGGTREVGSNILNICSENYGENLVKIAKDLFKKSVRRGEYDLERIPTDSIQVVYKDNPEKQVPVCRDENPDLLCWKTQIRRGSHKIILLNQNSLGAQELVVKYKAIDPLTANSLNSKPVGESNKE